MGDQLEDEGLLQLIFEQAVVGVCVFDLSGRMVRANPACCRLSQRHESELQGHNNRPSVAGGPF